jgi:Glycosyl hydrolase family 67 N-terminus.
MNTLKLGCIILALTVSAMDADARRTLFKNGRTEYSITLGVDASVSEKTAAKELQLYLGQIAGIDIPVLENSSRASGKIISIGWNEVMGRRLGVAEPDAGDDGFTCRSKGPSIFIYGGSERGSMYGVFSFLEKEFGVRWYTPECTIVPRKEEYGFSRIDYSESPALKYRFVQYFNATRSSSWLAHNKNNSVWTAEENEYGGLSAYWSAHTFGWFVPASEYFDEHPEYFSEREGKRIPGGQLCLTNPEVLEKCIDGVKLAIEENPLYWVYSVSQNDNILPCECDRCREMEERYGGHSGLMLWFVNQVADAIKPIHPDKYIGTFAYQYTRHAPRDIVPRDNVVIRLCSIECDFSHPIEATEYNKAFLDDLEQWSAIAPHLFIWDYVVNFNQYLAPYPNFQSLAPNIRTFRDHNAIGVQEEANYQSDGGEFSEMKAWVLAKLLWNPDLDTDELCNEFIDAYYGPAARKISEYSALCRALVKDDTVMGFAFDQNHPMYTEEFIGKASGILAEAKKEVVGNEEYTKRVDRVRAQILFLRAARNKSSAIADGTISELLGIMKEDGIRAREWQTTEQFIESTRPL